MSAWQLAFVDLNRLSPTGASLLTNSLRLAIFSHNPVAGLRIAFSIEEKSAHARDSNRDFSSKGRSCGRLLACS